MIALAQRKLRVMHVLHSLGTAGAERIVYDLARARAHELHTIVACLDDLGPLAEPARQTGVEVYCTHRRPGLDRRQVTALAGLIRRCAPDVIHAHQYTPYLYTALAASVAGFGRIVFTEHGRHYPDVVSPRRQRFNRLLRLRRDRVTAVCRFVADALRRTERLAGRDVRVIPNGIDCATFDRPRRRDWLAGLVGAESDAPLLIHVGRFHPVKDHPTAVRAFSLVRRAHPRARLLLVGSGPDQPTVAALAAELGQANHVHMLGPRPDVPDLLASADALVCSSVSEGACLAILEAMAAGLPVAATDVGGNGELVVHERTGLLSPRRQPQALAVNLDRLLADAALRRRLGQAGRHRARTLYDQRRMHQAFVDLYRQMTGEAP